MFILKKKKKRKKIIVLGSEKKIPLTWLTEHMLLVAVVLSQHAARVGMLHREVINLILFVMISSTCRRGSQAQAATLWQENKVRDDTRSGPKEEVKSHNRQEMWVLVLCCSFFPSVKWGQRLSYRKKLEEQWSLNVAFVGAGGHLSQAQPLPSPRGTALSISLPASLQQWPGSAVTAIAWRAALFSPLCHTPHHHPVWTPLLHLRMLILNIQCESGDRGWTLSQARIPHGLLFVPHSTVLFSLINESRVDFGVKVSGSLAFPMCKLSKGTKMQDTFGMRSESKNTFSCRAPSEPDPPLQHFTLCLFKPLWSCANRTKLSIFRKINRARNLQRLQMRIHATMPVLPLGNKPEHSFVYIT